ncbi:hypothetical protein SmJEL517_g00381 [Synchytrium microbalum]|uniref:U2A'/phosphoprotein 32 family A C-terminal domain-containing protein n=1 Tax=Synchytrium microbalum TaxID=1806994 RepID=A0A507CFW0_9FUNG|nr:uncharacterized protein SmJEL517_g00381 [Synchytrium microbalum]TPX38248.1 hypothetical protein SmJEL517_g00381 [Synchytrium microbalum]
MADVEAAPGDTPVETENAPVAAAAEPLSSEIIAGCLSNLSRTSNGLSVAYTKLDCRSKSIADIDLLRNFHHLKFVDLSDNAIKNIAPLGPLDNLLTMEVKNNQVKAVPIDLDARKYLQRADLSSNKIESFDVKSWPLCHYLNLNDNQLEQLRLPDFPQLYHLEARNNKLNNTGGIGAPLLQKLYLAGNQIDTIVGLESLTKLEFMHLRGNKISRLDGFSANNVALTGLNLRGNLVSDPNELDKLTVLPALTKLTLSETPLAENSHYRLEVAMRLKNLTMLDKIEFTPDEREEAVQYKEQLEAEKAEAAAALKAAQEEEERLKLEEAEAAKAAAEAEALAAAAPAEAPTEGGEPVEGGEAPTAGEEPPAE